MSVLESYIERKVSAYAKKRGCIVLKLYNPSSSGWPDRLYVTKQGVHFYIEYKQTEEGYIRPLQRHRIGELKEHNCFVYVVDNEKEGNQIVDRHVGTP